MRRPNPAVRPEDALAAWDGVQPSAASARVIVKCKLMTPMYGGGVEPGKVDCAMPIRPSAIRGQLRFWWRLLNRAGRAPKDLFANESDLWGGIASAGSRASRVALHVDAEPIGSGQMVDARSRDFPSYALILERGDKASLLHAGYVFTLTLRFPETTAKQRGQVIEALRWWASFGGVGARTRRGVGAIEATGGALALPPVSREEVEPRGGRMVLRPPGRNAIDAWRKAVDALSDFRQGRNVGRNPGRGNRPGRSRWPEPDAIRRHRHQHATGHQPEYPVDGLYPRAGFGLPIVFHFKDRGDPAPDAVLEPDRGDRMASPLILRPYFDGARYRPLALLLPGWADSVSVPVSFGSERVGLAWPEEPGKRTELANLVPPMQGRGTDALTAFLDYFEPSTQTGRAQGGR